MARNEPQRSCLGCREVRDKKDLLRFVLAPDRTLVPDLQMKLPGRGAYTCRELACFERASGSGGFARVLRTPVRIDPSLSRLYTEVVHG